MEDSPSTFSGNEKLMPLPLSHWEWNISCAVDDGLALPSS
jgi:hypothetical protein